MTIDTIESPTRLKRILKRLVNAIDTYEAASSLVVLKPGDLGYDEYEEALAEARKAVG